MSRRNTMGILASEKREILISYARHNGVRACVNVVRIVSAPHAYSREMLIFSRCKLGQKEATKNLIFTRTRMVLTHVRALGGFHRLNLVVAAHHVQSVHVSCTTDSYVFRRGLAGNNGRTVLPAALRLLRPCALAKS